MRRLIFGAWAAFGLAAAAWGAGCGGGSPAGGRPVDGGADATDGQADHPPAFMCPALAAGEKRGLGACCVASGDCTDGVCWNGFCTRTCAKASDCGPATAPSPLPAGTAMSCAKNQVGDPFSYCMPGSLNDCTHGNPTCPAGEACALAVDPAATAARTPAGALPYVGACMTKLIAGDEAAVGAVCAPESGPYACENEGGYLGNGCVAHRCSRACANSNDCPIGMICGPPPYSATLGGAASYEPFMSTGGGVCLGHMCGQVHGKAGLQTGQVTEQGADAVCLDGEICIAAMAVGAAGDTMYLSCIQPRAGALAYGAACSADPASAERCGDDTLCAARAGAHFCSSLCRTDNDCPMGSSCMEDYASAPLPNGSTATLAMCTPQAMVVGGGVVCRAEKDCAAGTACLPAGTRTSLRTCQATTGTKSLGAACAADGECRSGQCIDRDLRSPGGNNRTYCGGYCDKNSDCGAAELCLRVVINNNDTITEPRDDVIVGFCTPLAAPPLTGACAVDADCLAQAAPGETGGDACDPVNLTCYKKAAKIGDACAGRAGCPLGAYCRLGDPRFQGGACLSLGCDPSATAGVDACPAGTTCAQRATDTPLHGCYEACMIGTPCARAAESYLCDAPVTGAPASICLSMGGT